MDKQEIDWGGQAFPYTFEVPAGIPDDQGDIHELDMIQVHSGLSIREYIAIRAMQALISVLGQGTGHPIDRPEYVADYAVSYADALIKRLGEDDVSE